MNQETNPFNNLGNGNVDFFKGVLSEVLLNSRDENRDSLLSKAVMKQDLNCAKVIFERCASLLYCVNNEGYHALHHAAAGDDLEVLKFVIHADAISQGRGANNRLTRMLDNSGCSALMIALLNRKTTKAVKLLCAADPDFQYPPDSKGRTPLKLCMSNPSMQEMFKLLLEIAPIQSKTPMGSDGGTILHYAASKGDLRAVEDIFRFYPDCAEVVDDRGRNFLHTAAQFNQVEVVSFCVKKKKNIASNVLNGQDIDGNTPLSIAASSENETITLCLLSDPRVNVKLAAMNRHLLWAVRTANFQIIKSVSRADPDFFKGIEEDVLLDSRGEYGKSILSIAVLKNDLALCKMICKRCPSLVHCQSGNGRTPLHYAAWMGNSKMLDLFIKVGDKANFGNATETENEIGTNLIRKLLLMVDASGNTALHTAVSSNKLDAAKFLIEADPDAAYNTNTSGETPLSIAIVKAQSREGNHNTGKIRKLLLEKQPSQAKARTWGNGWTSLHFAASKDDLSAVMDIINFCPDCIELVDNEGMNFIHVAAKSKSIQVVKRVLGYRKIPHGELNRQDNNRNTPLHLAALSGDENTTTSFLYNRNVVKTTVNRDGQRVLDAVNFDYDKRKARVRGFTDQLDQKDLEDQSNFDLVVGALIATVSFTAGITVPGGYISDGPNRGTAVLSHKIAFEVFVISNTFALLFSLYAVFSHYCTRRLNEDQDTLYQLKVAAYCTLGALYAMMAAFISGSYAVLANSSRLAISVCAIGCCFYICSIRPIWKIVMQKWGGSTGGQWRLRCGGWWERLGRGRAVKNPPLSPDNV